MKQIKISETHKMHMEFAWKKKLTKKTNNNNKRNASRWMRDILEQHLNQIESKILNVFSWKRKTITAKNNEEEENRLHAHRVHENGIKLN